MSDKILCPWCGSEMEINTKEFNRRHSARMECHNSECNARGPMTKWHDIEEKAIESARAAVMRRYTPLLKPMILEEALGKEVSLEIKGHSKIRNIKTPYHLGEPIVLTEIGNFIEGEYTVYLFMSRYGIDWRCWERKPTDEERNAAEWET